MKKLSRILFGVLLLWGFSAQAAGEGEIEGCGLDEGVDCKVCIEDTLRRAKEQVAEEDAGGPSSGTGTEDR